MKNKLFTLLFVIGISQLSHAQILNGGFENWNAGLPLNWWGVVLQPYNVLTQTNDAHSGNYAVKLQVEDLGGTPFSSPLATGDGTSTTHPINYVPMSVSFWYKLNSIGSDYLSLTALAYSGGVGSGVAVANYNAASGYTYINAPMMYGTVPATVDSIAIVFTIGNASGTSNIGTEAKIDDVSANSFMGLESNDLLESSWSISPNPADESAVINFESKTSGIASIQILDATGKLIYPNCNEYLTSGNSQFEINTKLFNSGIYFCVIESSGRKSVKKLMITHQLLK